MAAAEDRVRALHAELDRFLREVLAIDPTGEQLDRWMTTLDHFFGVMATATRNKQYGDASLQAEIVAGLPTRGIKTGFVASFK